MSILATSGACILKAGTNVNSIFTGEDAEANWEVLIQQAEGFINTATRRDWVTGYSSLISGAKGILEDAASNLAAMYAIQYDMTNYTTRIEAETMLDVLRDGALRDIQILKDKKSEEFLT